MPEVVEAVKAVVEAVVVGGIRVAVLAAPVAAHPRAEVQPARLDVTKYLFHQYIWA